MSRLLLALALIAMTPVPVFAGEIADHAAAAEKALAGGDGLAAINEFDAAQDALWTAMPLAVLNVRQVDTASGFGIYSERANHIYKAGEKIVLYMEPVGFGYGTDGLGNSVIALSVDIAVVSTAGESLGTMEKVGRVQVASRSHNRELFFKLDLSLDGLPPGKYRCDFVMHDENSDKTAPFTTDIEIAG